MRGRRRAGGGKAPATWKNGQMRRETAFSWPEFATWGFWWQALSDTPILEASEGYGSPCCETHLTSSLRFQPVT